IGGVAELLPIRRERIEVLPTKGKHGGIVVAGREVARSEVWQLPCNYSRRHRNNKNMTPLPRLISVPVPIKQPIKNQCLYLRLFSRFQLFRIAGQFGGGLTIAFGIHI